MEEFAEECVPATSNMTSLRNEHQPCTTLCDCPTGTVQMVGPLGSDGQTLPTHCPGQNKKLVKPGKVSEKNGGRNKNI
jgi:hypothetical protein